jgi:hypothetical protein
MFKPSAKCAEEDSAMGSPATPAEAALVISGLAVTFLGLIAFSLCRSADQPVIQLSSYSLLHERVGAT